MRQLESEPEEKGAEKGETKDLSYYEHMLKLKALMALRVNLIRQQTENKVNKTLIKKTSPFYIVALVKERFGSFSKFISKRDDNQNLASQYCEYSKVWPDRL